jgi:hypothetical protein
VHTPNLVLTLILQKHKPPLLLRGLHLGGAVNSSRPGSGRGPEPGAELPFAEQLASDISFPKRHLVNYC